MLPKVVVLAGLGMGIGYGPPVLIGSWMMMGVREGGGLIEVVMVSGFGLGLMIVLSMGIIGSMD